ncbi:Dps family protein [Rarobacter incanus]|uniref:Starvation-inducible DNA-binding protein n=1 Tax=Rarobacter incanus TaxID=153494 RepID=A0A542SMW1_9MICO|nr:DNA starvation/stationary phase protection protein [Rarobacter incanus]TQK75966.1 starvation-inducible DNA-binding protein [Rarobacter incanus]
MPTASPRTAEILQATLVDLIDLSLLGKQAHWNVHGPHFRSIHLELDEIVTDVRNSYDTVAERLAQLGVSPDGRAATIASSSQVDDIGAGPIGSDKVVRIFSERIDAVSDRIKAVLPELDEDMLTQDHLIAIGQNLDQHAWFLRSQIK